jgi:hypothetical protein
LDTIKAKYSYRKIGFSARQLRLISAGSIRLGDIEQQEQWLRFPYDKKVEVRTPLSLKISIEKLDFQPDDSDLGISVGSFT